MKVEVVKRYIDKNTRELMEVGTKAEYKADRAKELIERGFEPAARLKKRRRHRLINWTYSRRETHEKQEETMEKTDTVNIEELKMKLDPCTPYAARSTIGRKGSIKSSARLNAFSWLL